MRGTLKQVFPNTLIFGGMILFMLYWEREMRVGVLDYVYHSLLRGSSLNLKGVRTFLGTVVDAMHMYGASNAYDFFTDEELSRRITASVKILRQVGIDNI
jgi:hypothetical protein